MKQKHWNCPGIELKHQQQAAMITYTQLKMAKFKNK